MSSKILTTNDQQLLWGPFTYVAKISNAITLQRVNPSPSFLAFGWGFRGRRIERRLFQFDQIQDGGRRLSWKTSSGHISAMHYPTDCMYARDIDHTLPSV